jgi:hypothetical protein
MEYELEIEHDSQTNNYIRFAVPQWDEVDGQKSGTNWVESKRICLFEVDVKPTSCVAKIVIGPGPFETRKAFIEAIDNSTIETKRREKITREFTIISTQPILTKREIQDLVKNSVDEALIEKVQKKVLNYMCSHIPPLNESFLRMGPR